MKRTYSDGRLHYEWPDLKTLMAHASPLRSGDELAGVAAPNAEVRAAAQITLSEVILADFINEHLIDYESDNVSRLILDTLERDCLKPV